jgi:uncharacterized protein YukE
MVNQPINYNIQTAVRPGYTQLSNLGDPQSQKALDEFKLKNPGASFQQLHDKMGDILENQRLAAMPGAGGQLDAEGKQTPNTYGGRSERYYQNELQKWGANYTELAAGVRHNQETPSMGGNPFAGQDIAARELVQGSNPLKTHGGDLVKDVYGLQDYSWKNIQGRPEKTDINLKQSYFPGIQKVQIATTSPKLAGVIIDPTDLQLASRLGLNKNTKLTEVPTSEAIKLVYSPVKSPLLQEPSGQTYSVSNQTAAATVARGTIGAKILPGFGVEEKIGADGKSYWIVNATDPNAIAAAKKMGLPINEYDNPLPYLDWGKYKSTNRRNPAKTAKQLQHAIFTPAKKQKLTKTQKFVVEELWGASKPVKPKISVKKKTNNVHKSVFEEMFGKQVADKPVKKAISKKKPVKKAKSIVEEMFGNRR